MPTHKINDELQITDCRFGKDDRLNVIKISSHHYDVMVYPHEVALFVEKLLEIPEIKSALNNRQETGGI